MLVRQVGRSGLRVSRLALGTMSWSDQLDQLDALELLTTFLDAGGTLVDTAPHYGDGAAQDLLGRVLGETGTRDRIVLASTSGLRRHAGDLVTDASRGTLLDQLDETLQQLGTDHLDLWQVQRWDPATPWDETLSAMEYAVSSGRVRYVGVANYSGWQTAVAQSTAITGAARVALVSSQVEYSLARRDVEHEICPALDHLGMGLLAWSPLGRGILTGKYRLGIPSDSRAADPRWQSYVSTYLSPHGAGVVEALAHAAEGLGASSTHVALAWLRDRPLVSSLLVGARTAEQLAESLASEALVLPPEIIAALDDVSSPDHLLPTTTD